MKRLFCIVALLVTAMLVHGTAFAWYAEGEVQKKGDRIFIANPFETPDKHTLFILLSDIKKATPEFGKCLTENKYVGVNSRKNNYKILIDKTSTCTPLAKYEPAMMKISGKITRGDGDEILMDVPGDTPFTVIIRRKNDIPKEFMKCINNGKYRGDVTIEAQYGHSSATHTWLKANKAATCVRK